MILRTSCDSEDMSWTRSSFNSVSERSQPPRSLLFSGKSYYSTSAKATRSLLFSGWRTNNIKTMFAGLDAKIKWIQKSR